jgi:hypothetical protein
MIERLFPFPKEARVLGGIITTRAGRVLTALVLSAQHK